MTPKRLYEWLRQGKRRQEVLLQLKQPMTAKQLCRVQNANLDSISFALSELSSKGFVVCLNPESRSSRLYWLTDLGEKSHNRLRKLRKLPLPSFDIPQLDWHLYGWVCFRHRSAIIRALVEPLQPATIKRRALAQNPKLTMSANNVRDIIRLFREKGIVQPVKIWRKSHLRYELTELGQTIKKLLQNAEVF